MGIFGKSKKKKKQQALLKAQQEKKAQEAAKAIEIASAPREIEEEKKEEPVFDSPPAEDVPSKSGDPLNDTVDTVETEEGPAASSTAIYVESETPETPISSEEPAISSDEHAEETTAADAKEAESVGPTDDSAWTPFDTESFKDWETEVTGDEKPPVTASLIIDDLQQEEDNKKVQSDEEMEKVKKDGETGDEPTVVEAEDQPQVSVIEEQQDVAETERNNKEAETKETETKEAETKEVETKEAETKTEPAPAFEPQKVFESAKISVSEAAVTLGLAASTAYTMAIACAGDIQAGFTDEIHDEIHDSASVVTRDTGTIDSHTVGTIDSRTTNGLDISGLDTTMDTADYTEGDHTAHTDDASRSSKVTFQDMLAEAPKIAAVPEEPAAEEASASPEDTPAEAEDTPTVAESTDINDSQDEPKTEAEIASPAETEATVDSESVSGETVAPAPSEEPVVEEKAQADSETTPPETEKIKPAEEATVTAGEYYPLADLQAKTVEGIDNTVREQYLSPEDFQATFSMTQEEFAKLPKWKRDGAKKKALLF